LQKNSCFVFLYGGEGASRVNDLGLMQTLAPHKKRNQDFAKGRA